MTNWMTYLIYIYEFNTRIFPSLRIARDLKKDEVACIITQRSEILIVRNALILWIYAESEVSKGKQSKELSFRERWNLNQETVVKSPVTSGRIFLMYVLCVPYTRGAGFIYLNLFIQVI